MAATTTVNTKAVMLKGSALVNGGLCLKVNENRTLEESPRREGNFSLNYNRYLLLRLKRGVISYVSALAVAAI